MTDERLMLPYCGKCGNHSISVESGLCEKCRSNQRWQEWVDRGGTMPDNLMKNAMNYTPPLMEVTEEEEERWDALAKEAYDDVGVMFNDEIDNPSHYTEGGIECWDVMRAIYGEENFRIYSEMTAFAYMYRARHKNGEVDLEKAAKYLSWARGVDPRG